MRIADRWTLMTACVALLAEGAPAALHDRDTIQTLSNRDYYTDSLPHNWWKVSLITIALLLAIPVLIVATVYACACCCGTPIPRFHLVRLPHHEGHLDEAKVEEGHRVDAQVSSASLRAAEGQMEGTDGEVLSAGEGERVVPAPAYSPPSKGQGVRTESDLRRKAKLALGITGCV